MATLTRDQKIAALAIPLILFGILGASVTSAHVGRSLTEEQQAVVDEARALREAGDREGARELLEEAGIPLRGHTGHGGPFGSGKGRAVHEAILANDYSAFTDAIKDAPFADMVNEALFATLVEAHDLREAGDYEGARALMEELGVPGILPGFGHQGRECIGEGKTEREE